MVSTSLLNRRIVQALLLLALGLCSCRLVTTVRFTNADIDLRTIHEPGFDYEISAHVRNDEPWWQTGGLVLRSTGDRSLELLNLTLKLAWWAGDRERAVVPYHSLDISPAPASLVTVAGSYHVTFPAHGDRSTFDLNRLPSAVPDQLRQVPPGTTRVIRVRFAQPGRRCMPGAISHATLAVAFEVVVDGQRQKVARTVVLSPRRSRETEFYNFKSSAWTRTRCD